MKLILSNGQSVVLKPKDTVIFPLRDMRFDPNNRHTFDSDLARNVQLDNNVYVNSQVVKVVDIHFME